MPLQDRKGKKTIDLIPVVGFKHDGAGIRPCGAGVEAFPVSHGVILIAQLHLKMLRQGDPRGLQILTQRLFRRRADQAAGGR